MPLTVQVDDQGRVHYIQQGGGYGEALLNAFGQTAGEAITPRVDPLGGELNARDALIRWLGLGQGGGPESGSPLVAGAKGALKGAGEGLLGLVVPQSPVDAQAQLTAAASAGLLGGLKGPGEGPDLARAARARVRESPAVKNLQTTNPAGRVVPKGPYSSTPETEPGVRVAAKQEAARGGYEPPGATRARMKARALEMKSRGTGPSQSAALRDMDEAEKALQAQQSHQNLQGLIAQNPGAGAGAPTYTGPFAEWVAAHPGLSLAEFGRMTGLF